MVIGIPVGMMALVPWVLFLDDTGEWVPLASFALTLIGFFMTFADRHLTKYDLYNGGLMVTFLGVCVGTAGILIPYLIS